MTYTQVSEVLKEKEGAKNNWFQKEETLDHQEPILVTITETVLNLTSSRFFLSVAAAWPGLRQMIIFILVCSVDHFLNSLIAL